MILQLKVNSCERDDDKLEVKDHLNQASFVCISKSLVQHTQKWAYESFYHNAAQPCLDGDTVLDCHLLDGIILSG